MTTGRTDTLSIARRMMDAGMERRQAEELAFVVSECFQARRTQAEAPVTLPQQPAVAASPEDQAHFSSQQADACTDGARASNQVKPGAYTHFGDDLKWMDRHFDEFNRKFLVTMVIVFVIFFALYKIIPPVHR